VHRLRDFEDTSYIDFLTSAAAIAPFLDRAEGQPVGRVIFEAVRTTRTVTTTNTNLGILLLLAPLAAVPRSRPLWSGIQSVLEALTIADAREVYQAVRLARPSGLGKVPEQDVAEEPSKTLREVMALAADRDLIARQYANGFREVFRWSEHLIERLAEVGGLEDAIIRCFMDMLAQETDSLIARKCGLAEAEEVRSRARHFLKQHSQEAPGSETVLKELDGWLRTEGHRRNPGTTADLLAACLFVLLREGNITLPLRLPWQTGSDHD
jgi:triphosphoribosyl-dephospho-CoA synthase